MTMTKYIFIILLSFLPLGVGACETLSESTFIENGKKSPNVFTATISVQDGKYVSAVVSEAIYGTVEVGVSLKFAPLGYKFSDGNYYLLLGSFNGESFTCSSAISAESEFGTDTYPVIELVNYFQNKS